MAEIKAHPGTAVATISRCLQPPCFALLGNAAICGVISGPHDRCGARLVWIATLTVLIAAYRLLGNESEGPP